MDQTFNGNGMVFGDHQPSGETILNDTEDDYLSTFFDNPNMAQQVDGFDSMFGLSDKSMSQGTFSATPFGQTNNIDPSSLDPTQPTYHSAQPMNNMVGHHQQHQQQSNFANHAGFLVDSSSQTQTQTMNNADMNAASSLYGFANKMPHQQTFSPATNGPQLAGSWGNLIVAQNSNMPLNSSSGGYPSAPNAAGRTPSFTAHAQPQAWNSNGDMSRAHPPQNARGADSHFLVQPNPFGGVQSQSTSSSQHLQQRVLPGVDFGSDPNFSNNSHYEGPQFTKDMSGNLLNVPLADKVRKPYGPHAVTNQHPGQQSGGSWGTMGSANFSRPSDEDELASGSQARKRHKGHDDRDSEHGWDPRVAQRLRGGLQAIKIEQADEEPSMLAPSASVIASPSSAKRPRLTDGQTSQVSNSPPANQDDDGGEASARKRGAKKRENLTEDQKRRNHIHSEKKRREIIQQGYADLNKLVPCLANGKSGLSRSECLQEIGAYLEILVMGNAKIEEMIGDDLEQNHPALLAVHAEWTAATSRIE